MSRIGLAIFGLIIVAGATLLSFVAHERPTHHIEKQIANVSIAG